MRRSVEAAAQQQVIAELKQLIRTTRYETIEELEDAVDNLLWASGEQRERETAASSESSQQA